VRKWSAEAAAKAPDFIFATIYRLQKWRGGKLQKFSKAAIFKRGAKCRRAFSMKSEFMRAAIRLSLEKMRRGEGGPFGAVVVRRGKIVGRGWNRVTSTNDPTAHAEITAIRDTCRRLKTFRLEIARFTPVASRVRCAWPRFTGRGLGKVFYAGARRDAAAIGFDDDLICREMARPGFTPQNTDATIPAR
jgi:guanine deaminase